MPPDTPAADAALDALARRALDLLMDFDPLAATALGDHGRDHLLPDWSPEARGRHEEELASLGRDLAALDPGALSLDAQVDREVLANHVEAELLSLRELRPAARDPLHWVGALGQGLHDLTARDFAPAADRAASFLGRVEAVPRFLADARASLEDCPRIHLEVARQQLAGMPGLFASFDEVAGAPAALPKAVARARSALDEFAADLEARLPDADPEGWRLGEDLWGRKLALTLDTQLSVEELEEEAFLEVCVAQQQMLNTARVILDEPAPGGFPAAVPLSEEELGLIRRALEKVSADRPPRDGLVAACREAVEEVRAFTEEAGIVVGTPPDHLRVELWPEHSRGVAVACLDPPGPFEEGDAAVAYFLISPVPDAWSEERATSFLREYNRSQIRVLAAHEAYPGHFVQLAFARRHPSVVRAAFPSGTFVEGWAVYTERAVMDAGFRGGDPEYALCFWKMRLRTALNALLDHSLHTGKRTPEACERMLTAGGFQEEGEAVGKVVRGRLTSTQLSTYFVGVQEVMELRHMDESLRGGDFDAPDFHRRLLSHGSVAPRHLARLMGLHSAAE